MSLIKKFAAAAALAVCTLLPGVAAADVPKVLVLGAVNNDPYYIKAVNAFNDAIKKYSGEDTAAVTAKANTALQNGKYTLEELSGYDVIILVDKERNWTDGEGGGKDQYKKVIEKLMENRPESDGSKKDLTFIIFTDTNATPKYKSAYDITDTISRLTGWKELKLTHIADSYYTGIALNTASPFQSYFTGINADNSIRAHVHGVLQCVPKDNMLFGHTATRCVPNKLTTSNGEDTYVVTGSCIKLVEGTDEDTKIATNTNRDGEITIDSDYLANAHAENEGWSLGSTESLSGDGALSIVVPQWQSNGGDGACILFTDDVNIFDNKGDENKPGYKYDMFDHQSQQSKLALAYLTAALSDEVCRQPKPDGLGDSVLAIAGDGIPVNEYVITPGGSAPDLVSDARHLETLVYVNSVLVGANGTCPENTQVPCTGADDIGYCCTKDVLGNESRAAKPLEHTNGTCQNAEQFPCLTYGNRDYCCTGEPLETVAKDSETGEDIQVDNNGACPADSEPCASYAYKKQGKCCSTVVPKSCETAYVYCEQEKVATFTITDATSGETETTKTCCGNDYKPMGDEGKQICCDNVDNLVTTTDSDNNTQILCCGTSEGTEKTKPAKSSAESTANDTCCAEGMIAETANGNICCGENTEPAKSSKDSTAKDTCCATGVDKDGVCCADGEHLSGEEGSQICCGDGLENIEGICCDSADNLVTTTDGEGNTQKLCCGVSVGTENTTPAKSSAESSANDTCCAGEVADTANGNVCCGGTTPQATGDAGSQMCCVEGQLIRKDATSGENTCCAANDGDRDNYCTDNQTPENDCCKACDQQSADYCAAGQSPDAQTCCKIGRAHV